MVSRIIFAGFFACFLICNAFADDLECFKCDSSETPYCINGTVLQKEQDSVICNQLRPSSDSRSASIADIFHKTKTVTNNTVFNCLKVLVNKDGKDAVVRTCGVVDPTLKSACDFLIQEAESTLNILDCYECEESFCNSGIVHVLSFSMLVFTWILTKV